MLLATKRQGEVADHGGCQCQFFHSCANGARRKTRICSLETDEGLVTSQSDISAHIVKFYKNLFGSSAQLWVHLATGFWPAT
jgi:hypothetical protein